MAWIPGRVLFALLVLPVLIAAVWGGLLRLQWGLPVVQASWISYHGPLIVSGFFGTVMGLARAGLLGSRAGLLVPLATLTGAWCLLLGADEKAGSSLFLAASLGYLVVSAAFFRIQPPSFAALGLGGGMGWAWGNFLWWRGDPIPEAMTGWLVLFVLTISSERLESVRWRPTGKGAFVPWVAAGLMFMGMIGGVFEPRVGIRMTAAGFLVLAVFLWTVDTGWKGPEGAGWRRYTKLCLRSAYVWLSCGALIGLTTAPVGSGFAYDAFLHCIFLGLVFSMVFSHVPLLLPRILKAPLPFHPVFYSHWILLQGSLTARIIGDLLGSTPWRRWGALLNALSLLLFVLNTVWAVQRGRRKGS